MSTWKRIGLGIGAMTVTLGLLTGAYVSAQNGDQPQRPFAGRHGGPGGFGGRGGPMGALGPMMAAKLNLTDAQKTQLKSIRDSHRDELKALAGRAMEAHQALEAAVTADTVNEGLIRTRASELATIESDLAVAHARIHAEVLAILTPEQQAQAKAAQAKMQQHMKARQAQRSARGR